MINSRRKGKVGELEFAKELARVTGCEARRGVQYSGGSGSPDVVTNIDGLHFEVKRTNALQLYPAMEQAIGDAGGNVPVVAHRRDRRDWVLIVRLHDVPRFVEAIENAKNDFERKEKS